MQPSADCGQALLEAVARDLNELERLCVEIDASIDERNWTRLGVALADSRRVTHSLHNGMNDAVAHRTLDFDDAVFARVRYVYAYRQQRMQKLQAIHDRIGERLRQLSRWKTYARGVTIGESPRRSAGLDSRH